MTPPGGQSRFCSPAKCPESGRRPVARWLSGRLGIRAHDTWRPPSARARDILLSAKLVAYCFPFRATTGRRPPPSRVPHERGGVARRAPTSGPWDRACIYAGRARPNGRRKGVRGGRRRAPLEQVVRWKGTRSPSPRASCAGASPERVVEVARRGCPLAAAGRAESQPPRSGGAPSSELSRVRWARRVPRWPRPVPPCRVACAGRPRAPPAAAVKKRQEKLKKRQVTTSTVDDKYAIGLGSASGEQAYLDGSGTIHGRDLHHSCSSSSGK